MRASSPLLSARMRYASSSSSSWSKKRGGRSSVVLRKKIVAKDYPKPEQIDQTENYRVAGELSRRFEVRFCLFVCSFVLSFLSLVVSLVCSVGGRTDKARGEESWEWIKWNSPRSVLRSLLFASTRSSLCPLFFKTRAFEKNLRRRSLFFPKCRFSRTRLKRITTDGS